MSCCLQPQEHCLLTVAKAGIAVNIVRALHAAACLAAYTHVLCRAVLRCAVVCWAVLC